MKVISTKFSGLKLIEANLFSDNRGYLREIFQKKRLNKNLIFHYFAKSKKNVFRGFHFQTKYQQEKLVTVLEGSIIDISIDLRKNSKTFGKIFKVLLSEKNKKSIFIPKGFAHGYQALCDNCEILYLHSNYYNKRHEGGINPLDPSIKIQWPLNISELSNRDQLFPMINSTFYGV